MRIASVTVYATILFLVGCQAMIYGTASEFGRLSLGMTKEQVTSILGHPTSVSVDGDKGIANLTKDLIDARANTTNLIIEIKP